MQNQIHLATGAIMTPLDYECEHTYHVMRRAPLTSFLARACPTNIDSFSDIDDAIAFIGNLEDFRGDELSIRDENDECHFAAEWDEDLGRYLNA